MSTLNLFKLLNKTSSSNLTTFLNPYSYLIARKNAALFQNFNIKIDGGLLVLMLGITGNKTIRESFDMTSLAPIVFKEAEIKEQSIFFIGSEPGVIEKAANFFLNEYPKLNIVGTRHGFFSSDSDKADVLNNILHLNPEIIVCGMGTPYQENFLLQLKNLGWQGQGYTCGGFFHQTANKGTHYYPFWFDKLNLRWIYRIYDEPKLFKRYFFQYPIFLIVFCYDFFKKNL